MAIKVGKHYLASNYMSNNVFQRVSTFIWHFFAFWKNMTPEKCLFSCFFLIYGQKNRSKKSEILTFWGPKFFFHKKKMEFFFFLIVNFTSIFMVFGSENVFRDHLPLFSAEYNLKTSEKKKRGKKIMVACNFRYSILIFWLLAIQILSTC